MAKKRPTKKRRPGKDYDCWGWEHRDGHIGLGIELTRANLIWGGKPSFAVAAVKVKLVKVE